MERRDGKTHLEVEIVFQIQNCKMIHNFSNVKILNITFVGSAKATPHSTEFLISGGHFSDFWKNSTNPTKKISQ